MRRFIDCDKSQRARRLRKLNAPVGAHVPLIKRRVDTDKEEERPLNEYLYLCSRSQVRSHEVILPAFGDKI